MQEEKIDGDWAHAPPEGSLPTKPPHGLDDHLRAVGRLAQEKAHGQGKFLALLAGLWHDLGKRRPGFQRYIRQAHGAQAHIERIADSDKTHSAAGALWAAQWFNERFGPQGLMMSRVLQYVIAGHHAGLDDWDGGLSVRLAKPETKAEFEQALGRHTPPDILAPEGLQFSLKDLPVADHQTAPGRFALWVRMLFSALVDADFLDTERYMNPERFEKRENSASIPMMLDACDAHVAQLAEKATGAGQGMSAVNQARSRVLQQCRDKAALPPGVFSLTVPTGGGKTLSSLAFALTHAARHGKRRIVYAIPYTSIIEQTADVFRRVFAGLGEDMVVEHHSNAESDPEQETARSRLACENWDAPLIVTTNVQLLESLFASRTSRCRKLHNLSDSVIVLDEAQLLPMEFLQPVVDVLRYLVQDFGATVLLCTATQPVLNASASPDPSKGLRRGIGPVTEVIDDVPRLYRELERVRVHLPASLETPRSWPELADEITRHEAVLAIVNRRADAQTLYQLVKTRAVSSGDKGHPYCWHLSALMCAQHRSDTLVEIKAALQARREALTQGLKAPSIYIVSTQLVEAGVDIDVPVVYRALAGLDSIAQAAGRCNREGNLAEPGQVHVFVPPTKSPPGLLTQARDHCKTVWHDHPAEPFALPLIERYFKRLVNDAPSLDAKQICKLLKLDIAVDTLSLSVQFRSAAQAFRLIDDQDTTTVLVRYHGQRAKEDLDALIGLLEREGPSRWLMRKLQRYGITVYKHQVQALINQREIREVSSCPGLYVQANEWNGFYDPMLGARISGGLDDPARYVAD